MPSNILKCSQNISKSIETTEELLGRSIRRNSRRPNFYRKHQHYNRMRDRHVFWSVCRVVSLLAMILFHRWCQAWCNLYMRLIQLFLSTTLLQLTVIIHRLLFGGNFSTLDDVDSVLCMVLVFELVLTPLFLFGMFGLLVWTVQYRRVDVTVLLYWTLKVEKTCSMYTAQNYDM
jgi:hypothetical protein